MLHVYKGDNECDIDNDLFSVGCIPGIIMLQTVFQA